MVTANWWKLVKTIAVTMVMLVALTSCSLIPPNEAEAAYIKDCKTVDANFEEYSRIQHQIYDLEYGSPDRDWQFWPVNAAVMIEGKVSRENADAAIAKFFPWIVQITQQQMASKTKKEYLSQDSEEWSDGMIDLIYEGFFDQLAKGTSFEFDLAKLHALAERDNSGYVDGENFADLFASLAPTDRFKSCDEALGLNEDKSLRSRMESVGINGDIGARLDQASMVAIEVWGCKRFGVGIVTYDPYIAKCAGEDFQSSSVATCTGSLKVTINTAEYGDCGKLRFEVFQADANTGGCMALGWWNDKNGNQQVGAFMFCGLEEGFTYNQNVSVGRDTTYTNNFGVEKTVLTFLDEG